MVMSETSTVTVAVAVPPVPPSFDVILPVVFTWAPPPVARTSMENVQVALAGIWPPLRLILLTVGVITPVVPVGSQKPKTGSGVRLSGLAIINPLGSVSLKATPVKSVAGLGLVMVNVRVTL